MRRNATRLDITRFSNLSQIEEVTLVDQITGLGGAFEGKEAKEVISDLWCFHFCENEGSLRVMQELCSQATWKETLKVGTKLELDGAIRDSYLIFSLLSF